MSENQYNLHRYPHKFFYKDLDLNLKEITNVLKFEYNRIKKAEMHGVKPFDDLNPDNEIFKESQSISTIKSREYNAFQMYYPFMHDLYSEVFNLVLEACEYYNVDYNSEQWICQAWFNINNKTNGGKLDWHDHIADHHKNKYLAFHGYYSVNAEPSITNYKVNNDIVKNINKNNRVLLSAVGFPHAMEDWNWDDDRITIAYDVVPLKYYSQLEFLNSDMKKYESFWEQHYFPLPKLLTKDIK